jgi:hypothetical protein
MSLGGMDGFEIAFFRALIAFIGLLPFSPSPAALDAGPNTLASMSGAASWAAPLATWVWRSPTGFE